MKVHLFICQKQSEISAGGVAPKEKMQFGYPRLGWAVGMSLVRRHGALW